jgi:hypothetical protein
VHLDLATFANQLQAASAVIDSTNPDLSAFFAHGGRLIIKTQSSDYSSNPHTVMKYYDALVSKFGQANVDRHVRLYVMANRDHGGSGQSTMTGEAIPQFVDLVSMATDWVEHGAIPLDAPELSAKLRLPPYTTDRCAATLCSRAMRAAMQNWREASVAARTNANEVAAVSVCAQRNQGTAAAAGMVIPSWL